MATAPASGDYTERSIPWDPPGTEVSEFRQRKKSGHTLSDATLGRRNCATKTKWYACMDFVIGSTQQQWHSGVNMSDKNETGDAVANFTWNFQRRDDGKSGDGLTMRQRRGAGMAARKGNVSKTAKLWHCPSVPRMAHIGRGRARLAPSRNWIDSFRGSDWLWRINRERGGELHHSLLAGSDDAPERTAGEPPSSRLFSWGFHRQPVGFPSFTFSPGHRRGHDPVVHSVISMLP